MRRRRARSSAGPRARPGTKYTHARVTGLTMFGPRGVFSARPNQVVETEEKKKKEEDDD